MLFPLSIFRHLHEQAFCSEDQNFEELPIKYMHKMFSVLLDLYESLKQFSRDSTESSVVKITIGDLNSKCSTLLAHILRNRPSLHLPNSILKTLQIY